VAVDWQEPVVLRRCAAYPLPVLMGIRPTATGNKHTTAPINHTRPSLCKHSPDGATLSETADSGWFTHVTGHPSAAGKRRTAKAHRPKTNILPLCHATNK